ncbi:DNA-binding transcriptional regulator, MarR family [Arthrobacter sp. 9AX]|uniref:MarR family winged helix-turn-helix transcriptional regulator n=1 Tax=Arthrobacter sp. 9AX TaxID=2653131 RepID=UPI0012F43376|nr:MarR family transcriptional regulator [Arthrobacter sp. 9AX]VXC24120.1 DNA-binding transcriptional regulator, MarR family [Arthrobacter sp. 9AX]
MPRQKNVGARPTLPASAYVALVPAEGLSSALASFAVWSNSLEARRSLMRDSAFPLADDLPAFLILNQLVYRGAARPTDLAEALEITTSHVSKIIARLEDAALVLRAPDPNDNRAVIVGLTDSGRSAGLRIVECGRSLFDRIFADWPDGERAEFTRLIVKFAHSIDAASAQSLSRVSGYSWSPTHPGEISTPPGLTAAATADLDQPSNA